MLIVQISDIHFGQFFREKAFTSAVKEINEIGPDVVLVTGDLTENGLKSEFEMAAKELARFEAGRVIHVTEIEDVVISVISSARPDRDDGEVGHRQNLWLERTLKKYREKVKIVAMHHHVIPVPDTGADQITVIDAGDVLRSLTKSSVDLVLCGHRHRPWKWRLESMLVVHAGSLSCEKLRGFFLNSYNVITVEEKAIEIKLKVVNGELIDFNEIVKRREILEEADISKLS